MSSRPRIDPSDAARSPVSVPKLAEMKRAGEPIVMVTAYDFPSATVAEDAQVVEFTMSATKNPRVVIRGL